MQITLHSALVPGAVHALRNLSNLLEKGAQFAVAKKIDDSVLLNSRLAPDMLPLLRQVHIACDTLKFAVSRLSGVEAPKFDDSEKTTAELQARIAATVAYVESVPAEKINGNEDKAIVVPRRQGQWDFTGLAYVQKFVLPNLYFHITTAYAILRHNGVEIGKNDFLNL